MIEATVDVLVHFHSFFNCGLLNQGWYGLRCWLREEGSVTGLAISDVLSPADPDDEAPEPWHVDRVRGCALSPLFPIKYKEHEEFINRVVAFRGAVPVSLDGVPCAPALVLCVQLLHQPLAQGSSIDRQSAPLAEDVPAVAIQAVRLGGVEWALQAYVLLSLGSAFSCQVSATVHTLVVGVRPADEATASDAPAPGRLVALSAPFFTRVRKVRGVPGPGMVGERHARAREGVEWAALARCGVQDAPGQTTRVPDSESKAFYDIDGDREAQDGDSGAPAAVRVAAQMCGTGAAMLSTLLRSLGRSVWEPETLSSMRSLFHDRGRTQSAPADATTPFSGKGALIAAATDAVIASARDWRVLTWALTEASAEVTDVLRRQCQALHPTEMSLWAQTVQGLHSLQTRASLTPTPAPVPPAPTLPAPEAALEALAGPTQPHSNSSGGRGAGGGHGRASNKDPAWCMGVCGASTHTSLDMGCASGPRPATRGHPAGAGPARGVAASGGAGGGHTAPMEGADVICDSASTNPLGAVDGGVQARESSSVPSGAGPRDMRARALCLAQGVVAMRHTLPAAVSDVLRRCARAHAARAAAVGHAYVPRSLSSWGPAPHESNVGTRPKPRAGPMSLGTVGLMGVFPVDWLVGAGRLPVVLYEEVDLTGPGGVVRGSDAAGVAVGKGTARVDLAAGVAAPEGDGGAGASGGVARGGGEGAAVLTVAAGVGAGGAGRHNAGRGDSSHAGVPQPSPQAGHVGQPSQPGQLSKGRSSSALADMNVPGSPHRLSGPKVSVSKSSSRDLRKAPSEVHALPSSLRTPSALFGVEPGAEASGTSPVGGGGGDGARGAEIVREGGDRWGEGGSEPGGGVRDVADIDVHVTASGLAPETSLAERAGGVGGDAQGGAKSTGLGEGAVVGAPGVVPGRESAYGHATGVSAASVSLSFRDTGAGVDDSVDEAQSKPMGGGPSARGDGGGAAGLGAQGLTGTAAGSVVEGQRRSSDRRSKSDRRPSSYRDSSNIDAQEGAGESPGALGRAWRARAPPGERHNSRHSDSGFPGSTLPGAPPRALLHAASESLRPALEGPGAVVRPRALTGGPIPVDLPGGSGARHRPPLASSVATTPARVSGPAGRAPRAPRSVAEDMSMGSRTPATGGTPAQASPLRAHGSVAAAAPRRETRLMRWSLAMGSRTKTEVRRAHDGVRKHRSFHGDVLRALRGVETDGGRGDSERATDAAESGPIGDVSQRPSVGRTLSQRLFARGTTHPASPEHRRGMAHLPKSATLGPEPIDRPELTDPMVSPMDPVTRAGDDEAAEVAARAATPAEAHEGASDAAASVAALTATPAAASVSMTPEATPARNAARRGSGPGDPEGQHLVVCVHGFQGSQLDLRLFKDELLMADPHVMVLMSSSNYGRTMEPIEEQGARLAREVSNFITARFQLMTRGSAGHRRSSSDAEYPVGIKVRVTEDGTPELVAPPAPPTAHAHAFLRPRLARLSFVGHSMGNLVIRAAIEAAPLAPYLPQFWAYVSAGGPHLGFLHHRNAPLNAGLFMLRRMYPASSLAQMCHADQPDPRNALLARLADPACRGLGRFKHVVVLASPQDRYVPYFSSRLGWDPAAQGGTGGAVDSGLAGGAGREAEGCGDSGLGRGKGDGSRAPWLGCCGVGVAEGNGRSGGAAMSETPSSGAAAGAAGAASKGVVASAGNGAGLRPNPGDGGASNAGLYGQLLSGVREQVAAGRSRMLVCDVHFASAGPSLDAALGREAHLAFLETQEYVHMLLWGVLRPRGIF